MSLLDPVSHALAGALAGAHHTLTALGASGSSGLTWATCLGLLVVAVRLVLLPLAARGVRHAHAAARARPAIQALAARYRHRTDAESLRRHALERRQVSTEHGVPRWGVLTALAQVPIWLALLHLVGDVAAGTSVGAMDQPLVASLGAAVLVGVPLADRGYVGAGWTHLAVVAGLAATAALVGLLTQRYLVQTNLDPANLTGLPDLMVGVQQWMPLVSAVGLLVAAGVVPVALVVYWVCNATWSLGQAAVIWRFFPTPGSPAALRRA